MHESATRLKRLLSFGDHPDLAEFELEPDGRYQLSSTTMAAVGDRVVETLAAGFAPRPAEDFPVLIVAWGKCRVGSTALTNLFGIAGVPAYYQPVKTIARHQLVGGTGSPWILPADADVLFAKEMAGPYVHYETIFDPVELLLRAGWPADRLHLLVLDRQPRDSLNSWMTKWEDRIGRQRVLDNFELSSLNYVRMRERARRAGVAVTHYPYEASRTPQLSVCWLFDRLGLAGRYSDSILTGWGERGDLNSAAATVIYPDEPQAYVVPGLHGSGDDYGYRRPGRFVLSERDAEVAEQAEIQHIYRTSVRAWDEVRNGAAAHS